MEEKGEEQRARKGKKKVEVARKFANQITFGSIINQQIFFSVFGEMNRNSILKTTFVVDVKSFFL